MRRFLFTVEQNVLGNELAGEPVETWETVRKVWSDLVPLSGREYSHAQQMHAGVTHTARTEFFDGANSRMRLVYGERVFNVRAVMNVEERNRELEWMVEEVV